MFFLKKQLVDPTIAIVDPTIAIVHPTIAIVHPTIAIVRVGFIYKNRYLSVSKYIKYIK